MKLRALGYMSTSTADMTSFGPLFGTSFKHQAEAIGDAASSGDLELVDFFQDESTGEPQDPSVRPGLKKCLAQVRRGWLVVVTQRDRLSVTCPGLAWFETELKRRKGVLLSLRERDGPASGDDPASVLLRRTLDAMTEFRYYERPGGAGS